VSTASGDPARSRWIWRCRFTSLWVDRGVGAAGHSHALGDEPAGADIGATATSLDGDVGGGEVQRACQGDTQAAGAAKGGGLRVGFVLPDDETLQCGGAE